MNTDIALGAMLFGSRIPEATSFDLLDRFVDTGGTVIDTANCYAFWSSESGHGGQSEETIGRWLAARPGMRDRIRLASKVGCEPTVPGGYPEFAEGLSAAVIEQAAQQSLQRLQTDHLDLYWAHREDRNTDLSETVAAFGSLVTQGLVRQVGASNHALWRVEQARNLAAGQGTTPFTALQLSYSYLNPRAFTRPASEDHRFGRVTDEVLDYTLSHSDIELWAYSPLLGGSYERSDRPLDQVFEHPGNDARTAALDLVATELGVSRTQVVLAWLTGGSPSITPIVGVSSVAQLDDAMAGARLSLSSEHRGLLDAHR